MSKKKRQKAGFLLPAFAWCAATVLVFCLVGHAGPSVSTSVTAASGGTSIGEAVHADAARTTSLDDYVPMLFVFMLATFVGLDVIRRVSRLLHTPLMSLTNAISAVAIVASILIAGGKHGEGWTWLNTLAVVAIAASMTNIVSGFLITDRMLKMFKRREDKKP